MFLQCSGELSNKNVNVTTIMFLMSGDLTGLCLYMAFRPSPILMNRGYAVVPSQSLVLNSMVGQPTTKKGSILHLFFQVKIEAWSKARTLVVMTENCEANLISGLSIVGFTFQSLLLTLAESWDHFSTIFSSTYIGQTMTSSIMKNKTLLMTQPK